MTFGASASTSAGISAIVPLTVPLVSNDANANGNHMYLSLKEIKPIIRCCKLCIEANIMLLSFVPFLHYINKWGNWDNRTETIAFWPSIYYCIIMEFRPICTKILTFRYQFVYM